MAFAVGQTNTVPAGQQKDLGVEPIPGATYAWDLYTDNTTINFASIPGNCPVSDAYFIAGNSSPTVSVMWVTPGTYYFRVIVTAPDGCQNLKVGEMVVLDCTPPLVSIVSCFTTATSVEGRPFRLKGGLPLGGTWSGGAWVNNPTTGMFNPQAAPEGPATVTYTYTDATGCSGSAQAVIQVNAAPAGFACGAPWTDVRDNKVYPTVQLGTQCWLGSNLNHGTMVPYTQPQTDNCATERYCYSNTAANCNGPGASGLQDGPGGLYQWDELMMHETAAGAKDICPPGWHIPTAAEWTDLIDFHGGNAQAGARLQDPNASPGFHALLSGVVYQNDIWSFRDLATIFWSSTPVTPEKTVSRGMNRIDVSVSYYESPRVHAFPARCVRNP